ncbi:MAG: hypothetical protein IPF51_16255 [Dehalococcoidia bacterium]|nr:hypothetical protein [Dehalococcoidia bacterium]
MPEDISRVGDVAELTGRVAVDEVEAGLGHVLDGGGHVLVRSVDELVVENAGGWQRGRGDEAFHADLVVAGFGGEAGGEALEGGLAHAMNRTAAAQGR